MCKVAHTKVIKRSYVSCNRKAIVVSFQSFFETTKKGSDVKVTVFLLIVLKVLE